MRPVAQALAVFNRLVVEGKLDWLCCVVIDELQFLRDKQRGACWSVRDGFVLDCRTAGLLLENLLFRLLAVQHSCQVRAMWCSQRVSPHMSIDRWSLGNTAKCRGHRQVAGCSQVHDQGETINSHEQGMLKPAHATYCDNWNSVSS